MASLSERERQVLELASAGHSVTRIADLLDKSHSTISTYMRRSKRKLGARTPMHAIALWMQTRCAGDLEYESWSR